MNKRLIDRLFSYSIGNIMFRKLFLKISSVIAGLTRNLLHTKHLTKGLRVKPAMTSMLKTNFLEMSWGGKNLVILIFAVLGFVWQVNAQDKGSEKMYFQGYSGGMMLHTGYVSGGKININYQEKVQLQGMPFGIGGVLRFHFGKHLRIGGEGYNSTLHYGKNKSYATLSCGGLLIDYQLEINKFTLFFGGTIGGGSVKNISVVSNQSTEKNAVYRNYSLMLANPFLGMEYAVAQRIRLIAKVDYLFNISKKQPDFSTGVRLYAGIVFFHARKK